MHSCLPKCEQKEATKLPLKQEQQRNCISKEEEDNQKVKAALHVFDVAHDEETTKSIACPPTCLPNKRKNLQQIYTSKIKEPAFRVIKKWRRARYIAPKKGKQKGTKVKHCKNKTTPPGTLKCWNIFLSEMKNVKPPAQQQCM